MKLYFAGAESWEDLQNRMRIERRMLSYFYLSEYQKEGRERLVDYDGLLDIFIDSGAFTAHEQEQPIKLERYGRFLDEVATYDEDVTLYANLDEIGDPEGTLGNQLALEDMGLSPVPVFHFGQKRRYLRDILDRGYDMIALGGMVGQAGSEVRAFLDSCFSLIREIGR